MNAVIDEQLRNIGKEDVWGDQSLNGEITHKYPSAPKKRWRRLEQ